MILNFVEQLLIRERALCSCVPFSFVACVFRIVYGCFADALKCLCGITSCCGCSSYFSGAVGIVSNSMNSVVKRCSRLVRDRVLMSMLPL